MAGLILPITPGLRIANENGGEGTLSLIVRSTVTDEVFAMSCSHVMARFGVGVDDAGGEVIVEAAASGSTEERKIGVLSETFSRVDLFGNNDEDMALARLTTSSWLPSIPSIGCPATWQQSFSAMDSVWWFGATSGLGFGQVLGPMHHSIPLIVAGLNVPAISYRGLIAYSTNAQPGDSGAPVLLANTKEVIGIHVGGDPALQIGYFFPIAPIFTAHDLELVIQ
jgi:trypsin